MKKRTFKNAQDFIQFLAEGETSHLNDLSLELGIPYHTLYNWFTGRRDIPDYFLKMFVFWVENH